MTIKEMADVYITNTPGLDDGVSASVARRAYEQGAMDMIYKAGYWINDWEYAKFREAMDE